jgi:protease I
MEKNIAILATDGCEESELNSPKEVMEEEGFKVDVINPDKLRRSEEVLNFVKDFFDQSKPVAAICHGPWTLISADVVKGKTLTSFYSIRKDLENAGALWEDKKVVVDGLVP